MDSKFLLAQQANFRGWRIIWATIVGLHLTLASNADDLDVLTRDGIPGGVLTLQAVPEFMALSSQDQDAVLHSIWIVLSARNAALSRIEVVQPNDAIPLFEYDTASGLTTAAPVETQ